MFKDYIELAVKTASPDYFDFDHNIQHGIEGVVTEAIEILEISRHDDKIDRVKFVDEIGDLFWYTALICKQYNMDFNYLDIELSTSGSEVTDQLVKQVKASKPSMISLVGTLVAYSGQLLNVAKKAHFYKGCQEDLKDKILDKLLKVYFTTCLICKVIDVEPDHIQEVNIKKLQARYPGKFSAEHAVNRDRQKEQEAIDNTVKLS